MCGIFGLIISPEAKLQSKNIASVLQVIAILSESRGKDSSGIAFRNEVEHIIQVIKGDISIRELIKSKEFNLNLSNSVKAFEQGKGFCSFGHARLVTNGSQLKEVNNQPVLKDNMLVIHNGIIINVDDLWTRNPDLQRDFLIDTEIIPTLIRKEIIQQDDLVLAFNKALNQLEGTYSIAAMFEDLGQLVLATNNGSLYFLTDQKNFIVFASEEYFLTELKKDKVFKSFYCINEVEQLTTNFGLIISLDNLHINIFSLENPELKVEYQKLDRTFLIEKHLLDNKISKNEVVIDPSIFINRAKTGYLYSLLENNIDAVQDLKRCTRCILPETFPFIEYDSNGVCNYCNNYVQKNQFNKTDKLLNIVEPFKRKDGKPECIVPFSGGRDSTFALHKIVNELNLRPITYTYDWGMVTDLARRNIARVCGKLGVENIVVSADIRKKRDYIRMNIEAWLRKPDLGMIPLFMSGDKAFHLHLFKLQKQTGISLNIWGENYLENTDFKVGFAGIAPEFNKTRIHSLSKKNSFNLMMFLFSSVLKNTRYINSSILDNLKSQFSRSFHNKKDGINYYDYVVWDENTIIQTITEQYDWEHAIDTASTWRIGDGTAAFYNYIYYTVAGFTEFDTFRSNQIREGMMDRASALALVEKENLPRFETLRWYLEIVGVDFETVIKKVNSIKKHYLL